MIAVWSQWYTDAEIVKHVHADDPDRYLKERGFVSKTSFINN